LKNRKARLPQIESERPKKGKKLKAYRKSRIGGGNRKKKVKKPRRDNVRYFRIFVIKKQGSVRMGASVE